MWACPRGWGGYIGGWGLVPPNMGPQGMTTGYSRQVGGTHRTGMLSCFVNEKLRQKLT